MQPPSNLLQKPITGVVAQRVIYFLEAIQIKQEQSEGARILGEGSNGLVKTPVEQGSIRQLCQTVVQRPVQKSCFACGLVRSDS